MKRMKRPNMELRRKQAAFCRQEARAARERSQEADQGYHKALARIWDCHARHWEEKVRQGERICRLLDENTPLPGDTNGTGRSHNHRR